jgi:putative ABC transport system permease protein
MANSEIKAAARTLYREKSYAIINLSGLSLAIACCLILGLYLRSELTYDQHNLRHKQIFRVVNEFTASGSPESLAYTSPSLGPMLKQNFPEVRDYVRFRPASQPQQVLIKVGDKAFYWDQVWYADANVFDIFTHEIIYGDPKTALKDPAAAAVSETFAKKYFGNINPIGKTIQADLVPQIPRKITLVFRDLPDNTHLKYDVLFPETTNLQGINPQQLLFSVNWMTYLLMPENYKIRDYKVINDSFYARFMESRGKALNMTWRSWLQPLADIHLYSDVHYDLPTGNRYYIYGFAAVAVFILLVACINYINLAIARATKRAKEIAMRKILGIPRMLLMVRFLGESILFSLIALVVGATLVELLLKLTPITDLLGKPLALGLRDDPVLLLWMLGLSLFAGVLSGLYPAIYLSSISPMSALTGSHRGGRGSLRLREILVLMQFTVSVIVIACTLLMAMQMRYVSRKPLGFETQNRVLINMRGLDVIEKYPVIKNELMQNSRILGVTASSGMVGTGTGIPLNAMGVENNKGIMETVGFNHIEVADNFMEVMGMKLLSGRDFSKRLLTDMGTSLVVNESMVKNRGWQNPIGKRFQGLGAQGAKVIGVAKDFHVKSLHNPVAPFVMRRFTDDFQTIPAAVRPALQRVLIIHIAGTEVPQTLKFIQDKFAAYDPKHPFEYAFLDDSISKLYLSEARLMKMIGIFSGICIFISCLGLFGLAAFTTEQRSKEIGIRKVLGASASQIILMLSRKILGLVLAGSIIASVVAYYIIDEWLSGFAYRVPINLLVFALSAVVVIAIAYITIALQSYKTAQSHPALMMRYE